MFPTITAFVGGAALHILWKWFHWADAVDSRRPSQYFKEYKWVIGKGLILDIILFAMWLLGVALDFLPVAVQNPRPLTALVVGFLADMMGKDWLLKRQRRLNNGG